MSNRGDPPHLLVLWDVDHTLIETRGVGRAIYERAFLSATGRPLEQLANISGRTELDITSESLRINGITPTPEAIAAMTAALVQGYEDGRDELRNKGRALPCAADTLSRLASQSAIFQSVLTGNLRAVARIKLEVFGLDQFVDLAAGAYGDDDPERPTLVELARTRAAERTGVAFKKTSTLLIGDTPKDVHAALAAGVAVIAVATGKTDAAGLRAAGAAKVARDLRECEEIVIGMIGV